MSKIGVDTGGTFTDFVFFDGIGLKVHKVLSTPHDPSEAILKGLKEFFEDISEDLFLIHGTTVATNALLERKGAKVILITTKGFENVFEIGRQNREKLYDLYLRRKDILVDSEYRLGIKERVNYNGKILEKLFDNEIDSLIEKLKFLNAETIAICFLNSYQNPENEILVEKKLNDLNLPITRSSKLIPEFREYERTSTTIANSYLIPKVKSYMNSLKTGMKKGKVMVMQSNGGIISPDQAGDEPVRIITSGPAGGVVGAFKVAQTSGREKILTYDMGGTSTDISLCDGSLQFSTENIIDEVAIKVPMIDVSTIGAGGGSIAYIDQGRVIKVGPQSAGADPGPACYGKGNFPTVTDANLVLGRIEPSMFLGGSMKIFPERSEDAIKSLEFSGGPDVKGLAEIIINIANSNMERALRVISIGKGYDPREFTLVSFGGAGGLHACELAEKIGIRTVMFSNNPGVLSALGMLMADSFKDYSISHFADIKLNNVSGIQEGFNFLEGRAKEDFPEEDLICERFVDLRYKRQSHELTIKYVRDLESAFHSAHNSRYGYFSKEDPIEVVALRLRANSGYSDLEVPKLEKKEGKVSYQKKEVFFSGKAQPAKIYSRDNFYPGFSFSGKNIVLEDTSTIFIPRTYKSEVDEWGNIVSTKI